MVTGKVSKWSNNNVVSTGRVTMDRQLNDMTIHREK